MIRLLGGSREVATEQSQPHINDKISNSSSFRKAAVCRVRVKGSFPLRRKESISGPLMRVFDSLCADVAEWDGGGSGGGGGG